LTRSVTQILEIIEIYKKEMPIENLSKPPSVETTAGNKQETTGKSKEGTSSRSGTLDSESNVVEYSISTPKQQQQTTSQSNAQGKQSEVVTQVKLLVKDHTNIEEAMSLAVGMYVISQNF